MNKRNLKVLLNFDLRDRDEVFDKLSEIMGGYTYIDLTGKTGEIVKMKCSLKEFFKLKKEFGRLLVLA